jgi:Tol biopolymer transport system component
MVNFINPDIQLGNEFMKTPLSIRRTALRFILAVFCLAVSAMATPLQLVTTVDPAVGAPASGGGNSMNPIITPDGRFVLFASTANNLALTGSNTPFLAQSPPKINVFLRDRTNGTTILASINLAGTGGGNGDSIPIELSTNGQYALFESSASDLVPGDTNNVTDVFVRDLVNGTNILVSIGMNGSFANGVSGESAMTPDGRYVAFASTASNFVPNDTNGIQDIFVRDLQTGVTTLASPGAVTSTSSLPSRSVSPLITPDGRYVAFLSTATNLVPGVITVGEVYVRDLTGGVTFLASTNAQIVFSGSPAPASCNHAISDNGQFVAFESFANLSSSTAGVIQRYNLQTSFTDVVYSNAVTAPTGYPLFRNLDMTPDGRFIAFVASTNSGSGIFLWDAQTATTTLVSGDANNTVPAGSVCDWPVVDPSGRFVAFLSTAVGLATNIVAGDFHMYLCDVLAGTTTLLDADTNGFGFPKDFMNPARLTPNGHFLAFDCTEEMPVANIYNQPYAVANRSLVPNDNNHAYDVFVRDLTTNTTELISVRQPALPSQTPAGSGAAPIFSVDTGGRYIAFASAAGNLVPNYTNLYRGVFVQDLLSGTNLLVSADTDGFANAGGMSTDPVISGDGRYVAFTSYATNLVAGDNNNSRDVFVRDLQTGTTTLVSVDASLTSNNDSYSPVISANGRYVLFYSMASIATITGPSSGGGDNLYLRDLQAGATYALTTSGGGSIPMRNPASMTPDGHFVAFGPYDIEHMCVWDSQAATITTYTIPDGGMARNVIISPDGNRIVYYTSYSWRGCYVIDRAANTNWTASSLPYFSTGLQFSGDARFLVYSTPSNQVTLDTNGVTDVYLYDFVTRSNFLVSQGNPPGAASGPSDSPVISNDGRFVAYRSTATNLVAGATSGLPNVFLYDRQTGTTTILSANASGKSGNNRSFAPQFSGDGQTVVFQSWASDLVAQDYNQVNDLVAVKIATSNPIRVFAGQMVFAPASLQSPTLTWPAANGKTYQVQFKNSPTGAGWQPLNGNTWVSGNQGYATDLAPNTSLRFYRVVAY